MCKQSLGFFVVFLMALNVFAQANSATTTASQNLVTTEKLGSFWNRLGLRYFQGVSMSTHEANLGRGGKDSSSDLFLAPTYKLDSLTRLELRQNFTYNQTGTEAGHEMALDDTALIYDQKKAFNIFDDAVDFQARLYLPSSDFSQRVGKLESRLILSMNHVINGRWTLNTSANARFYGYTLDSDGQNAFRSFIGGTLIRTNLLKGAIEPYMSVGVDSRWRHSGLAQDVTGKRRDVPSKTDLLVYDVGSNITVSRAVSLNMYVEQVRDLKIGSGQYEFLNDLESSYIVELSATL